MAAPSPRKNKPLILLCVAKRLCALGGRFSLLLLIKTIEPQRTPNGYAITEEKQTTH